MPRTVAHVFRWLLLLFLLLAGFIVCVVGLEERVSRDADRWETNVGTVIVQHLELGDGPPS